MAVAGGKRRLEARHIDVEMSAREAKGEKTHERTKRSRLSHFGFFGLNFMNLL